MEMFKGEGTSMSLRDMDAMLWFGERWCWFPGAQIGAESEFEWRDNRVFLLEPDGSAVEGIVSVGEIARINALAQAACHVAGCTPRFALSPSIRYRGAVRTRVPEARIRLEGISPATPQAGS
jgi:hypothetical protein